MYGMLINIFVSLKLLIEIHSYRIVSIVLISSLITGAAASAEDFPLSCVINTNTRNLVCDVRVEGLRLYEIIYNRGNCQPPKEIIQDIKKFIAGSPNDEIIFGDNLKLFTKDHRFGDQLSIPVGQCNLLEAEFFTNVSNFKIVVK